MSEPTTAIVEVDELGVLLAQLQPLKKREEELKAKLKAYGKPVLEGALFRCTVAESIEERLDNAAIRAEMGPKWVSEHAKIVIKTTVRVGSKTAGG